MMSAKANKWTLGTVGLAALLATSVALAQKSDDAEVQLQAAYHKQMVEGQLEEAIRLYTGILTRPGVSRAVAAKALVQMGQCYEKLGNVEARKAYERVLRDYADQSEAATEARTRLAALAGGARTTEMVTRRVWADPDVDPEGAPSPDGKYLPYVDWETGDLAVFDLLTHEKRRLTHKGTWAENGDEFAENSVPSPDSRQVAYAWYKSDVYELRVIGIDGSHPRAIYRNESIPYVEPKAWSPDGKQILSTMWMKDRSLQLAMISVADGSVHVIKDLKQERWDTSQLCLSPDGRYIAYSVLQKDNEGHHDVFLLPTDGGRELPVVTHPADDYFLGWTPDGKSMLFGSDRTGAISAWAIDVVDGIPRGSPRLVKSDIGRIMPLGFTQKGAFYYALNNGMLDVYTAAFDFTSGKLLARPKVVTERSTGSNSAPEWSPDGKSMAYMSVRHHPQGSPLEPGMVGEDTIVIRSLESGDERELVSSLRHLWAFVGLRWSPDGHSFLIKADDKDNRRGIFRIDAQTGEASMLLEDDPSLGTPFYSMTPDGKSLVYAQGSPKGSRILIRDLQNGQVRELTRSTWLSGLALSPDGQEIAFDTQAQPSEVATLKIVPVAGGEPRDLYRAKNPTAFAWNALSWTRDGKHIVFGTGGIAPSTPQVELWEIPAEGGEPQKLDLTMDGLRFLRINPDGQRVVFQSGRISYEVGVMENFLPLLKAAK